MASRHIKDFIPDEFWGPGNWVDHKNCPDGTVLGVKSVRHSKDYHGRPLKAELLD